MLKKTISYKDFDDNLRTEDFYFNMTKSELTKLSIKYNGTLQQTLARYTQTQNYSGLQEIFDDFIDSSYGVKSDDGRRFMKSPELTQEFKETNAYDQLFMDLTTDPKNFNDFLVGIMPPDLAQQVAEEIAKRNEKMPA